MFYTLLSSMLFTITLFFPKLGLFTMTTFVLPLYAKQNDRLFLQGCIWGLIVFGSYWYWIIILFKHQSLYSIGIALWVAGTIWCCLFSGVWIYFFNRWPIISTILFFIWVSKGILLPLGKLEGMPFLNLLVLLGEYPLLLKPLYYLGDVGMLIIIFLVQKFIVQKNIGMKITYFATLLMVYGLSLISEEHKNHLKDHVRIVTPWWHNQKRGAMFDGYRLAHDLCVASSDETIQLIVTPESTFCFDIQDFQNFIPIWCDSANNIPILLGTHLNNGGFPHNAILLLHNNEVARYYFKEHKMPFLERSIWIEQFLDNPILSGKLIPEVKSAGLQNDLLYISGKFYQLYMCSEFFTESKKVFGYPILLLWNDSWLSCDYMKKIAELFIKYFEKKYRVEVYHIATSGQTNIK